MIYRVDKKLLGFQVCLLKPRGVGRNLGVKTKRILPDCLENALFAYGVPDEQYAAAKGERNAN